MDQTYSRSDIYLAESHLEARLLTSRMKLFFGVTGGLAVLYLCYLTYENAGLFFGFGLFFTGGLLLSRSDSRIGIPGHRRAEGQSYRDYLDEKRKILGGLESGAILNPEIADLHRKIKATYLLRMLALVAHVAALPIAQLSSSLLG